ncbi:hypothetical protein L107_06623 [Cyanobium sp. Copco_Reservoir_LC18]|uniref:hypothetical protein n=1 Tax=Cyanobium sp. Copco_Reservoir_LC18 TaxID=1328305 RepID=UPI00135B454C|nr:hypothetical protein [Cyanobium sp. Copco_Reservoir_LC18]KAF0654023.1 hypothetical protein L107_06623 [Cyanobium sp. Copco_Reservoir_LC18]
MADDTNTPLPVASGRGDAPERAGRSGPNREPGGFRIRLSDNEMQAARALQEAFGLRSTVAVLGFSLRTLADQLEKGQLEALVAEHRAQAGSRTPASRGGEPRRGGGDGQPRQGGRGGHGAPRIDPFARPSRPAAPVAVIEAEAPAESGEAETGAQETVAASDAAPEAAEGAVAPADSEGDATPEA